MAGPRSTTQHIFAISNDDSPETFTKIPGLGDIGDVGSEATVHDASSHDTADGWGSVVMGIKRQQPITFPIQYQPELDAHSWTDVVIGLGYLHETVPAIKKRFIEHPAGDPANATIIEAFVTGFKRPVPVDGILQAMVTLTPTGKPVHLDATSITIT